MTPADVAQHAVAVVTTLDSLIMGIGGLVGSALVVLRRARDWGDVLRPRTLEDLLIGFGSGFLYPLLLPFPLPGWAGVWHKAVFLMLLAATGSGLKALVAPRLGRQRR